MPQQESKQVHHKDTKAQRFFPLCLRVFVVKLLASVARAFQAFLTFQKITNPFSTPLTSLVKQVGENVCPSGTYGRSISA
jgi:hypothetical protein